MGMTNFFSKTSRRGPISLFAASTSARQHQEEGRKKTFYLFSSIRPVTCTHHTPERRITRPAPLARWSVGAPAWMCLSLFLLLHLFSRFGFRAIQTSRAETLFWCAYKWKGVHARCNPAAGPRDVLIPSLFPWALLCDVPAMRRCTVYCTRAPSCEVARARHRVTSTGRGEAERESEER